MSRASHGATPSAIPNASPCAKTPNSTMSRGGAVYYACVIEIPTTRWTAQEAARYRITMPDEVPKRTQERAYTSQIGYTP